MKQKTKPAEKKKPIDNDTPTHKIIEIIEGLHEKIRQENSNYLDANNPTLRKDTLFIDTCLQYLKSAKEALESIAKTTINNIEAYLERGELKNQVVYITKEQKIIEKHD
jgi:polyphosphate kinase